MDTTAVMAVFDRYCMFCRDHRKRLHCLRNYKAQNENYKESIEKFLNLTLDRNVINCMYVCEKCINTCEMYSKFKTDCVKKLNVFIKSNTDRIQRMENPYPSALKCANEIIDHSDSVGKQSLKTTRDTSNEDEEEPSTSIRSCSIQELEPFDHTYSVTSRESGKTYFADSVNHCETASIAKLLQDKAVRKMLEHIYNALKEMSRGKVYNQRWKTNIVTEIQWLLGVLEGMEQNCPQFLEVLLVILGKCCSVYFLKSHLGDLLPTQCPQLIVH